jgi:uncharacterized protein (DUF1697 family)
MSAATWVALLKGINVGRNKRIAMADLRTLLEALGYDDVRTLVQSGNAIFTTSGSAKVIEQQISSRIESDLGLEVPVVACTSKELAAVVDENPFVARGADPKDLAVTFLSKAPPAAKVKKLDPADYAPDEFEFGKRVIYTRQPNGVIKSRLPDWNRELAIVATARNWKTTIKLRDLAGG